MLRISYELDSAIRYRQSNRIFGNIDNTITPLSTSEIVTHELEHTFLPKLRINFERDSAFFAAMEKKKK